VEMCLYVVCVCVGKSVSSLCYGMGVTVVWVCLYTVVEHNLTTYDVSRRRV
jgi:hypothetical protein